jgi:hypothetical protein
MAPAKKKYKTVDEALFYANKNQGGNPQNAGIDGTVFDRLSPKLKDLKGSPESYLNEHYNQKGVAKPAIRNPVTTPISSQKKKPKLGDGWSYNTTKA